MPEITIRRDEIRLWSGAEGALVLNADVPNPLEPLRPGRNPIVDATFRVEGDRGFALGGGPSVGIGIKAGTKVRLLPIWKEHAAELQEFLDEHGLAGALGDDNLLLEFELGAGADLSAAGSFRYGVLKAGATVEAGLEAAYMAVRPYPRTAGLLPMLQDFFGRMALPATVTAPPAPGEVIAMEFGGYLNFGASLSAGYEVKGTQSLKISELSLSEHYQLSVVGKLAVSGKVAGRFAVEVRPGAAPGWARVMVRRRRSQEMKVAADVQATARLQTDGLPRSGKEFLGALMGVEARNWLNLIDSALDEAGQIASVEDLKKKVDALAGDFLDEWAGKAVDRLLPDEVRQFQEKIRKAGESYRRLDQTAIALFDRYFHPALNQVELLKGHLETLRRMTSWDNLKGEIDPLLWNIVRQLTNGDPLGWALGRIPGTAELSLPALQKRIDDTLALIQDQAHEEIRQVIRLAKEQFRIDQFMSQLETIDEPEDLKKLASSRLRHFLSRLLGRVIDENLSSKELKDAFKIVREIAGAKEKFFETFDNILREAAAQSYSIQLHAAYQRVRERDALIDVEIRLLDDGGAANAAGQRLMQAAGRGDFQEILANYQPELVRLREGVLTHQLSRQGLLKINVVGWHRNFRYESMHRVLVNTRQQIRSSDTGQLTVFTNVDMTAESERRKNGGTRSEELMQANFLLRFLGETRGILDGTAFDKKNQQYALEVITGRTAVYGLTFTDKDTTPDELADYLEFARDLGLDRAGATVEALAPTLEKKQGSYGDIRTRYEVRYTPRGLESLFAKAASPAEIRDILCRTALANYIGEGSVEDVAWLFASDDVYRLWDKHRGNFIDAESILRDAEARIVSPIPGIRPRSAITNSRINRVLAACLFEIQESLVRAFTSLQQLLAAATRIPVKQFENALADFGAALDSFDRQDLGDNSIFAVFDGLVRLHAAAGEARSSSLTFTSVRDGQERTRVFVAPAAG